MSQKPQYQHYVPQFLLRKFSTYVEPDRTIFPDNKTYTKAQKRAKERAKVKTIDFSDGYAKGKLSDRLCHKVFGIHEMYDAEIEKALSSLEQDASKIIKLIEADFNQGKTSISLKRSEKDLLRKFLFIMGYRGRGLHGRFGTNTDDYTTVDRGTLLDYMHSNGFKTPKDVWLHNLRAFIKVDMSTNSDSWTKWLQQNAYPADALWFVKNMTTSYLCFCTPDQSKEEFVLTQNAYGVFEGPNSASAWMDWHTFTPINGRLIIILRNQLLDNADSLNSHIPHNLAFKMGKAFAKGRDHITSQYQDPIGAQSWLKDMPVGRPGTSYRRARKTSNHDSRKVNYDQNDVFTFIFFMLPSAYVQRINSVFLEQAVLTDAIVYHSEVALRLALDFYLEIEKPGFKVVVDRTSDEYNKVWSVDYSGMRLSETVPEYSRREYLEMLERVARELGSSCTAKYSVKIPETVAVKPPMTAKFLERYTSLGFDNTVTGWVQDEEQGRRISRLWLYINKVTQSTERVARQAALRERLRYVYDLPPHRVWLHLRMMRLLVDRQDFLKTANRESYMRELVSSKNDGPEDIVADYHSLFASEHLSRAMLRASAMSQWIELNTTGPFEQWRDRYCEAAWSYVGRITDCDIPCVKEAALRMHQQVDLAQWQRSAVERGYPDDLPLDMWIREKLFDGFESLAKAQKLAERDAQRLKVFIFKDLYPSWTRLA